MSYQDNDEFEEEVIEDNEREHTSKSGGFDWFKRKSNKMKILMKKTTTNHMKEQIK